MSFVDLTDLEIIDQSVVNSSAGALGGGICGLGCKGGVLCGLWCYPA